MLRSRAKSASGSASPTASCGCRSVWNRPTTSSPISPLPSRRPKEREMTTRPITVLKFGSSVLARKRDLAGSAGSDSADALALLVSTGESTAVALLALALERAGISAAALDPARIGLVAHGEALDADLLDVDVAAIERVLAARSVAVVPGFF